MEDVVRATKPMIFLKGAMHKALEEQRCSLDAFIDSLNRSCIGCRVEPDREDFQRTGAQNAQPSWVAAVCELTPHSSERGRVALHIATRVHEIE